MRNPAAFAGEGFWKLQNVKVTELQGDHAGVSSLPEWMWETVLRPSILTVYLVAPERLAIATLWDNIQVLGNNAQKTSRFEIAFWGKVFYPVTVLVMMALAMPFAQFQRRQGGMGFRLFAGTMLGLTFFLVRTAVLLPGCPQRLAADVCRAVPAGNFHAARVRDAALHRTPVDGVGGRPSGLLGRSRPRQRAITREPASWATGQRNLPTPDTSNGRTRPN